MGKLHGSPEKEKIISIVRWPTTATAKYNNIHHRQIKFVTAKYNSKQQIQITPGKLQTLTAKAKTIIIPANSHALRLKTLISRLLTPAGQFLTPDWKMWVVAVLLDIISKNC